MSDDRSFSICRLYLPEAFQPAKRPDEIKQRVVDFAEKVNADDPKDACKYLMMEEQKCLQQQQFEMVRIDFS